MPTYEATPRFTTDLDRLTTEQRRHFRQSFRQSRAGPVGLRMA
ncbi:hypothetical protein ACIPYQ_38905 [Streptomyces sp. NPDC090045]